MTHTCVSAPDPKHTLSSSLSPHKGCSCNPSSQPRTGVVRLAVQGRAVAKLLPGPAPLLGKTAVLQGGQQATSDCTWLTMTESRSLRHTSVIGSLPTPCWLCRWLFTVP